MTRTGIHMQQSLSEAFQILCLAWGGRNKLATLKVKENACSISPFHQPLPLKETKSVTRLCFSSISLYSLQVDTLPLKINASKLIHCTGKAYLACLKCTKGHWEKAVHQKKQTQKPFVDAKASLLENPGPYDNSWGDHEFSRTSPKITYDYRCDRA